MASIFDDILDNLTKNKKTTTQSSYSNKLSTNNANNVVKNNTSNKVTSNNISTTNKSNSSTSKTSVVDKVNNFLTKYLTTEGVNSLPDDSTWKKISQSADKAANGTTISLNSNNIGANNGITFQTAKNTVDLVKYTPVYQDIKKSVDTAKTTADLVVKGVSAANKARVLNGTASPIQNIVQKVGQGLNKVDELLLEGASNLDQTQQHHLDTTFSAYVDKNSVYDKIKNDAEYGTKLVDVNSGEFIDYSDQIEALQAKIDNTPNPYERKQYNEELNTIKQYETDQKTLLYSSYYDYLVNNGASDEQLNEFKKAIIRSDNNGIERALTNFGGTVSGYVGNTLKGIETLYAKTSNLLGVDYQMGGMADKIINDAEYLQALTMGNAGDVEKFVYEVYDGMAPFLYALATAGIASGSVVGNQAAAQQLMGNALLISDVGVLGSQAKKNMEEGYDFDTSFNNALLHAALNHITESIGGESLANILTGEIGEKMLENTTDYVIRSLANQFIAEATEEGAEAVVSPIIDNLSLNKGITVQEYMDEVLSKDTLHQMLIGGLGGLVMGTGATFTTINSYNSQINELANSIDIKTKEDYDSAGEVVNNLNDIVNSVESKLSSKKAQGIDTSVDESQIFASRQLIKAYRSKMAQYMSENPYANAFTSTEKTNVGLDQNARQDILNAAKPTLNSAMTDIINTKEQINENSQKAVDALSAKLVEQGIDASAVDATKLTDESVKQMQIVNEYAKATKKDVAFADMVGKDGDIIDGLHDSQSGKILINPNAKRGALSTLVHEFTHGTESSKYYGELQRLVEEYYGDNFEARKNYIKNNYSTLVNLSDEGATKELVAVTTQNLLGNQEYVNRLVKYDTSLAYRMYEEIKYLNDNTGTVADIEQNFMRAFSDANAELESIEKQLSTGIDFIDIDEYNKAVKEGNTAKAKEILDKVANEKLSNSKIRNEEGDIKEMYHGTGRADRVGNEFREDRATSGPMAFFTDSKSIAENYAKDKKDTSLDYEEGGGLWDYSNRFKYKGRNLFNEWWLLPRETRRIMEERAPHITYDDEASGIIYDENQTNGIGDYNYQLGKYKGDVIKALKAQWLDGGNLINEEERFMNVLELSGMNMENAQYLDPNYREEKVYSTYLNITNPFNTINVNEEFVNGLEKYISENNINVDTSESASADPWDKHSIAPETFIERLNYDIADGTTHAWTSIPDYVTDYLKTLGYDGIIDKGGKRGGQSHQVAIPFYSNQIFSSDAVTYDNEGNVIPLENRFDASNNDIRYSKAQNEMLSSKNLSEKAIKTINESKYDYNTVFNAVKQYLDDFTDENHSVESVDKYIDDMASHYSVEGFEGTFETILGTNNMYEKDVETAAEIDEAIKDNKWVDETQKVLDEANMNANDEDILTVDNIDDILHQREISPRTLEAIQRTKDVMLENADKWVMGYDTIKAQYPMFSNETLKSAVYEILINGELSGETYDQMANTLSSEFAYENKNGDVKKTINDFVNEAMSTFTNVTKYQAGEIDTAPIRRAMTINQAYNGKDVEGITKTERNKEYLNKESANIKADLQRQWQDTVNAMVLNDQVIRETKGKKSDGKVSDWKTMDQNIFEVANGNKDLYDNLKKKIRYELLDGAARTKSNVLSDAQTNVIDKIKELGIKEGSNEDIATQYILEGHTEEIRKDLNIDSKEVTQETLDEFRRNPYVPYTINDLKENFDYEMENGKKAWENILEAAGIIKNAYDQTYAEVLRTQLEANGDVEGNAELNTAKMKVQVEQAFEVMENIKSEIVKNGSKESTQTAYELAKKKFNQLVNQYNSLVDKDSKNDSTRRQLTPYRENYSHHIVKNSLKNTIDSIRNAELLTPTELAGTSDYTKPNTAWASFSAAQEGGKYNPTALGSYASYMTEAANVISYNPVILSLRQFNKDIKATAQGTTLNRFSEYLNDYCNMLAGKRNNMDRGFQKLVGAKTMKVINSLNSYAKAAALTGNIRSGLVQFANIPNGMGILESRGGKGFVTDISKGIKDWILDVSNKTENSAIDQSPFMTNRYFDFDTGKSGLKNGIKEVADTILTIGDKVGAETIWWSAYEQGNRLGVENAISYADDVTRNAIAGRTKEDMALAMNSSLLNLIIPFQVENNNLYQTLKQEAKGGKFTSIATYNVAAFLFNAIIKGITNGDDEVLPEVITPMYDEIKKAITKDQTTDETAENILFGEIAEFISLLPYGSTVTQLIFGDESDTIFGDYDPNRYGTTNIGLSGLGNMIKDIKNHEDDPNQQILDVIDNLVSGYVKGGKQISRTVEGLQSMGGLPDYKGGEIQMSPINYNNKGKVAYVNDQGNIADWIRSALFGKYSTSEARKYVDNNFKSLSTSAGNIFDMLQKSNDKSTFENYASAKQYQEDKSDEAIEENLRKQLIANGTYNDYMSEVTKAYEDYVENFDTNDDTQDMKSFKQFASSYGITSDDLKQDTYQGFYDTYDIKEDTQKVFSEALDIENTVNALGKSVANSAATQRRVIYEKAGIYNQILEFIEDNNLDYSDFGLTKTVVGYNANQINNMLEKIGSSESYEGTASVSSSAKSSSSKTSTSSASKAKAKQKSAMLKYINTIQKNQGTVFDVLSKMTSMSDAKANAEKIRSKYR